MSARLIQVLNHQMLGSASARNSKLDSFQYLVLKPFEVIS